MRTSSLHSIHVSKSEGKMSKFRDNTCTSKESDGTLAAVSKKTMKFWILRTKEKLARTESDVQGHRVFISLVSYSWGPYQPSPSTSSAFPLNRDFNRLSSLVATTQLAVFGFCPRTHFSVLQALLRFFVPQEISLDVTLCFLLLLSNLSDKPILQ